MYIIYIYVYTAHIPGAGLTTERSTSLISAAVAPLLRYSIFATGKECELLVRGVFIIPPFTLMGMPSRETCHEGGSIQCAILLTLFPRVQS